MALITRGRFRAPLSLSFAVQKLPAPKPAAAAAVTIDFVVTASSSRKRSHLFIRPHNDTLSIVAVCINNPERSPVAINRCNTAPTPSGLAEIVSGH
jgi:hypothetical protein